MSVLDIPEPFPYDPSSYMVAVLVFKIAVRSWEEKVCGVQGYAVYRSLHPRRALELAPTWPTTSILKTSEIVKPANRIKSIPDPPWALEPLEWFRS